MSESGTQTDSKVEPPAADASSRRWKARHGCALFLAVALAGVLLLVFVVVPLFQPEVDPNLKGPRIVVLEEEEVAADEAPDLRGSITDLLVQPRDDPPDHPLDPLLEVARMGLERMRSEISDYTAMMVKQERVGRRLQQKEFLACKVRHHQLTDEGETPKSIYIKFFKPASLAGQEAIWVEGRNNGKLIGHAGGIANLVRFPLEPTSLLAMRGNRYPITELGIETLLVRMIEKGERDRQHGECEVEIDRDVMINDHRCTRITITHPEPRDHFEFHMARIYIDDELNIPVGYEGFLWPKEENGRPILLESYFYQDIKLNVGLVDLDFDPDNPAYNYPGRLGD